nr:MAG TPA: helix-turn-helix domain protein [Caudoviricetes sp.]
MNKEFNYPRDFKGVWIPKRVFLDERLNAIEKIILIEIDSLDAEDSEGCYASNEYLANFCKCSMTKVSTSISKLIKLGYLYVSKNDGRKRYLKSRLSNSESQDFKKSEPDLPEMKESNNSEEYSRDEINSNIDSPTELKEEKKNAYHSNEWFNSQHIKNMLTEENIQYTPIDRKSFNWSAFKNQVSVRLEELGYTTSPYTTNRFLVVSKYFFKRYEERTRKPHIKINQDALDNILDKFGFGPNPDYFQNVEIETYMKVIDEYFGTSFSEYTDHHYSHFMSGYIRKNLLMKVEDKEDTL